MGSRFDLTLNEKKDYRIQKRIIKSNGELIIKIYFAKFLNDKNENSIKLVGVIHLVFRIFIN